MEVAVNENEVINPSTRLKEKDKGPIKEAPTITAKPIIRQFKGRINLKRPINLTIIDSYYGMIDTI